VVSKSDLDLLGRVETREAQSRGMNYFKYSDDESMLQAIEEEKEKMHEATACAVGTD
jgi:hypothetical protein